MRSVGVSGSAYGEFRRALATGDPMLVMAAAQQVGQMRLDDALDVVLVLTTDRRYRRAAAKWIARATIQEPSVQTTDQLQLIQGFELMAVQPAEGARVLEMTLRRLGLTRCALVLRERRHRWTSAA